ncbi:MAG: hypothetical protein Ct9H300mP23_03740 [Nitrospinota bacterium]|nr:MAG: hypothetical protein Ct9H300mP23_03740 [Nitrospinota bacterium]
MEEGSRDVRIIEPSREQAHVAADALKKTVVMHGSGTDMDLFNEINMKEADFFLALRMMMRIISSLLYWLKNMVQKKP